MSKFTTEDQIKEYNLELLDALGYGYKHGSIIEPEGAEPERQSFSDVLLKDRLTQALARINPHIPPMFATKPNGNCKTSPALT